MDPISDMLTIIRNGQKAEHKSVVMPLSKIKLEIAAILKRENYIDDYKKSGKSGKRLLQIDLKHPPAINEIKRISRSGKRLYVKADKIKQIKNGYGIAIISTPNGLMTNKEAYKAKLGGEILLEIW